MLTRRAAPSSGYVTSKDAFPLGKPPTASTLMSVIFGSTILTLKISYPNALGFASFPI